MTLSRTASAEQARVSPALAALTEIAEHLASSDALMDVVPGVLESVRLTLGAHECALWLQDTTGLMRSFSVGGGTAEAADVIASLAADELRDGLTVVPLAAMRKQLGALSVERAEPLSPEEHLLLSAVGNLLAPALAHAERSHHLEVEVELRTRQIEEQRRTTEKIIDSLPVGLYVIDREYRITVWNRKRETGMQGVSREEAIGRTIFEILHRQPAEMLRREFDDVFSTGRIQQFQMESTATGDVRTYRISKIPMKLDDSTVSHVITIGEDITEWKEALERFAQAEKLAAIGQLAAGVMHEINNPLATIAACAESTELRVEDLRADGVQVPQQMDEYLRLIDNEVHRCKRIVDGLLDFSRPKPSTKDPVDVNQVVTQTLFLLKHHPGFKKLNVHTNLDPELPPVVGSTEQLVQVFMALLINAMDAMGERGTVSIRTRAGRGPSEAVIAEIVDEGHGIARSDASKIFEPFYTTKPPGRGTGLGLSICYGIIADHGGRIEVDSVVGSGSTFRIVLPSAAMT